MIYIYIVADATILDSRNVISLGRICLMIGKILYTDNSDWGALIARVFLGLVILPHGLQKLLGMFGGYGFSATVEYFYNLSVAEPAGMIAFFLLLE